MTEKNTTIPKVDMLKAHLEQAVQTEERERLYLGMSGLGEVCDRAMRYQIATVLDSSMPHVRVASVTHEPRTARIFRMGHVIEDLIVTDLKAAGVIFESEQDEYSDFDGVLKGHSDGVVTNVPTARKTRHLLEIKSMAEKYFTKYKKVGMEKAQPKYWVQAQVYAYYAKVKRILFVVENKNNQARHYERAEADTQLAEFYISRAGRLIKAAKAGEPYPERVRQNPNEMPCLWCNRREVCHA